MLTRAEQYKHESLSNKVNKLVSFPYFFVIISICNFHNFLFIKFGSFDNNSLESSGKHQTDILHSKSCFNYNNIID